MSKSYSINIQIDDVSFVDINEDQIENIRTTLEETIRENFKNRITSGVGDIKIIFNEK